MIWKIEPRGSGWWLCYQGKGDVWWHVHDKWSAVFPTLDAVFSKIKEKSNAS